MLGPHMDGRSAGQPVRDHPNADPRRTPSSGMKPEDGLMAFISRPLRGDPKGRNFQALPGERMSQSSGIGIMEWGAAAWRAGKDWQGITSTRHHRLRQGTDIGPAELPAQNTWRKESISPCPRRSALVSAKLISSGSRFPSCQTIRPLALPVSTAP